MFVIALWIFYRYNNIHCSRYSYRLIYRPYQYCYRLIFRIVHVAHPRGDCLDFSNIQPEEPYSITLRSLIFTIL